MSKVGKPGDAGMNVKLPVLGLTVSRCCIDQALSLEFFSEHVDVLVRFEGVLRLRRGGSVILLNAEDPRSLAPALELLGQRATVAQAEQEGGLLMQFADGSQLEVDPDPDYEAWELTTSAGFRLVSSAGGGLVTWQGTTSPPSRR
jgi:hypothetical protein